MDRERLTSLIQQSESILENLKAIDYDGLKEKITELESVFNEFKEGGEGLLSKNDTLQIGIVGQVKAGKSSFLNSLFFEGENVLPKASTPMTAGLTIIEFSEKNTFEIEYYNEKDWDIFVNQDEDYKKREQEVRAQNPGAPESIIRKEIENRTSEKVRSAHEMVSTCSSKARQKIGQKNDVKEFYDLDDLQNVLEQYVGANGEYTSVVKSLYIKMNDDRLKGLRIVDTPGVNDPVVSRENRTRTFLHSCHGVFLLSASTDFLGSGDISFLNSRIGGSGIGTVVLLASKFDSVLQDIGAEREMKHEERADLVDTIEMQTKKFKRRLRELSDTIDENLRGKIKLDTTAGIGYSIAHKPKEKWDNVEKQVVQQMKRYYPDYFTIESDIKESFEGLANTVEIKEKYLDGLFMENKDSIISEKVKDFFVKHRQEISATINQMLNEFKHRQEQLNETTIAEIQKQKEIQGQLFDGLKSTFAGIFNNFSRNIQNEVKHIANNVRFNEIRTIPIEQTLETVTCKGWLWGHNTKEMCIDHVNTFELCTMIGKAVEHYGTSWNDEWQKLFDNARKEMSEKLNTAISDFEIQVMSSSFKDTYYRNLIDRALDELRDNKELAIGDVISNYQRMGDDIANSQFYPSGTEELKEEQVKSYLSKCLREHNLNLINSFRILSDSIKEDVKKEINMNLQKALAIIEGMKTSFSENLKKEGKAYLDSLERDMAEKTIVLKKIESIVSDVTELSTLYK
ncbi:MAG: dynamin family protein [Bacteroidaceae bacterium]|nr:dynamin family protein [Bacteroidaceae bacterium]